MTLAELPFQPAAAHQRRAYQHHPRQLPAILRAERQQIVRQHIRPVADRLHAAVQLPVLLILQIGRVRDPGAIGCGSGDHPQQDQHRNAGEVEHHPGVEQRFDMLRLAHHAPAHQPHQGVGQQNIAIPEEKTVNETKQRQQGQARLDPAFSAGEQKLQTGAKQQREQGEKFHLRQQVEKRPGPGIAEGRAS